MADFVQLHSKYRSDLTATLTFPPHLHSHIEMIYVWEGESNVRIDGNDYRITAGDMLLIFPNCVHSFMDGRKGKYFCSIFPCEAVPAHSDILLAKRPQNPFISKNAISDEVKALLGILSRSGENDPGLFSGVMTAILYKVLPEAEITEKAPSDTTRQILDYCLAHYREPLTLNELSKDLHISTSRLSHIFEEKVGLPFRYYVNYLRVLEACRLLLSSRESISAVALSCGFDSIRSFNRNFLYIIGKTPTEYRNEDFRAASQIF